MCFDLNTKPPGKASTSKFHDKFVQVTYGNSEMVPKDAIIDSRSFVSVVERSQFVGIPCVIRDKHSYSILDMQVNQLLITRVIDLDIRLGERALSLPFNAMDDST